MSRINGLINLNNVIENKFDSITKTINNIDYKIIFNGEIYNKEELKKEFSCTSMLNEDIVLLGFANLGKDILNKINGPFAFAIFNETRKELFIARDHFGLKPLYYTIKNNKFIFASEVKYILENENVSAKIDNIGISEIFGLRTRTYTRKWSF